MTCSLSQSHLCRNLLSRSHALAPSRLLRAFFLSLSASLLPHRLSSALISLAHNTHTHIHTYTHTHTAHTHTHTHMHTCTHVHTHTHAHTHTRTHTLRVRSIFPFYRASAGTNYLARGRAIHPCTTVNGRCARIGMFESFHLFSIRNFVFVTML